MQGIKLSDYNKMKHEIGQIEAFLEDKLDPDNPDSLIHRYENDSEVIYEAKSIYRTNKSINLTIGVDDSYIEDNRNIYVYGSAYNYGKQEKIDISVKFSDPKFKTLDAVSDDIIKNLTKLITKYGY